MTITIGVLALQGNFAAHCAMLQSLNVATQLIKLPQQLQEVDGLIIPGGESTTMIKQILDQPNWQVALADFYQQRLPIFGTCAGLILLSKNVQPTQFNLGWLDITVLRNGYGCQLDSHVVTGKFAWDQKIEKVDMPLIRAPRIINIGVQVKPLITENDNIYMVEEGAIIATTFHPEMTKYTCIHQYFLDKVHSK